ncbi:MAG TPA: hypothetical protein VMB52_04285 [Verrucomicrobiae bacterium]|nr:hypothetical protein [Verrucomicrobiae bacterium]
MAESKNVWDVITGGYEVIKDNQVKFWLAIAGLATAACIGTGIYIDHEWTDATSNAAAASVAHTQNAEIADLKESNGEYNDAIQAMFVGGPLLILDIAAVGATIGSAVKG